MMPQVLLECFFLTCNYAVRKNKVGNGLTCLWYLAAPICSSVKKGCPTLRESVRSNAESSLGCD